MSRNIKFIRKRDGRIEPFDVNRIQVAILKAMIAVGRKDEKRAQVFSKEALENISSIDVNYFPEVEETQDIVEKILIKYDEYDVAKAYYNKQHKNIEVNKFFNENQKSIKQVHLHDVNENGRGHRVIGSGLIDFNEILLNIKDSPVIDYCIEVRPRSKALESLRNLKQIFSSSPNISRIK